MYIDIAILCFTAHVRYVLMYLNESQVPHDHLPHVFGGVHLTNISLEERQEQARSGHRSA